MDGGLTFTVYGHAEPAGSKRAFAIKRDGVPTGKVTVVDANRHAKTWQREVRDVAREVLAETDTELLTGPLVVSFTFYAIRPRGHYGTGRNTDLLKPSAPPYPTGRPDSLKLARGTEDALTGLVWRDDAQVVTLTVRKRYGAPERCEILIQAAAPAAPFLPENQLVLNAQP